MTKPIVGVLFKAGVPKGSILVPYFLASVLGSQTLSEQYWSLDQSVEMTFTGLILDLCWV